MKNCYWRLIEFTCMALLTVLPMSLCWWQYSLSGADIVKCTGMISNIDTQSLDDCDAISKSKYLIAIHYNYTYANNPYNGTYELCETNDGVATQLKIHPIGSNIFVYLKNTEPQISSVKSTSLMNQYFLGFAILFTFISVIALSFLTCCFEEITKKLQKVFLDKTVDVADNVLGSIT